MGLYGEQTSPTPSGSFLHGSPREALGERYLSALLAADRRRAAEIVREATASGLTIRDLYLDVFQPVQREIGRLWQSNEISVAEEHFCTASTQALMAQFYPQILATPRIGRKVVVACVGDELHEIGTRMVADFFEMAGWDSIYAGASTPTPDLVRLVCREFPDLVALGVTMHYHLDVAAEAIRRLRAECDPLRILIGGYALLRQDGLWQSLGADGCAEDAQEAVALGNALIESSR